MGFKRQLATLLTLILLLAQPVINPSAAFAAEKGRPGKVTLLPDDKYAEALLKGIRGAKKEIVGCYFLFKATDAKNSIPMAIVRELVMAKKRGVDVTFELEMDSGNSKTIYNQNRHAATIMTDAGVKVRFDTPKTTTHVKAMVIDRRYTYLGSHNLTQSALRHNNELSVMIDSAEIAEETIAYLNSL